MRRLRLLTRYRVQLQGDRTRQVVRLELMLEDASINSSMMASSLKTVSARVILGAMIDGQTDARRALSGQSSITCRNCCPQQPTLSFNRFRPPTVGSRLLSLIVINYALSDVDLVGLRRDTSGTRIGSVAASLSLDLPKWERRATFDAWCDVNGSVSEDGEGYLVTNAQIDRDAALTDTGPRAPRRSSCEFSGRGRPLMQPRAGADLRLETCSCSS